MSSPTSSVGRKLDMCILATILDIMLNHSYFAIMKYVQQAANTESCSII